jgi:hypothetical protein
MWTTGLKSRIPLLNLLAIMCIVTFVALGWVGVWLTLWAIIH